MDDRLSAAITAVMDFSRRNSVTAEGMLAESFRWPDGWTVFAFAGTLFAVIAFWIMFSPVDKDAEPTEGEVETAGFPKAAMIAAVCALAPAGLLSLVAADFRQAQVRLEEGYAETRSDCAVLLGAVAEGDLRFMTRAVERATVRTCGVMPLMKAANSPRATVRLAMSADAREHGRVR